MVNVSLELLTLLLVAVPGSSCSTSAAASSFAKCESSGAAGHAWVSFSCVGDPD